MAKAMKAASADADRERRMKWWHEARFGMFVHWGLYSQLGRGEWAMHRERISVEEYEPLADTWKVKPMAAREWCRLARKAGMKYIVMTTKHHEGFCLWDSQMTDYNSVKHSPGRDLVAEFVKAARAEGLKVGFYYSLMDWHHPDGMRCVKDEAARRRFVDFTHGCVRELMSNYGKIDILWYDVSYPLRSPEAWESAKMNAMARQLQPHILINNRSQLDEDFGTPEGEVRPEAAGRAWEACMTFNGGSWGYMPSANIDMARARDVVRMLRTATGGEGNLLLNIGPKPDGSVVEGEAKVLTDVGKWLNKNGEAVYGKVDRTGDKLIWNIMGNWTLKGRTAYWWCERWPGREIVVGDVLAKVKKVTLLATGQDVKFEQQQFDHLEQRVGRLILKGLPASNPDRLANIAVFKIEFAQGPKSSGFWGV